MAGLLSSPPVQSNPRWDQASSKAQGVPGTLPFRALHWLQGRSRDKLDGEVHQDRAHRHPDERALRGQEGHRGPREGTRSAWRAARGPQGSRSTAWTLERVIDYSVNGWPTVGAKNSLASSRMRLVPKRNGRERAPEGFLALGQSRRPCAS